MEMKVLIGAKHYEINEAIAMLIDEKNKTHSRQKAKELEAEIKALIKIKNDNNIGRASYLTTPEYVLKMKGLVKA